MNGLPSIENPYVSFQQAYQFTEMLPVQANSSGKLSVKNKISTASYLPPLSPLSIYRALGQLQMITFLFVRNEYEEDKVFRNRDSYIEMLRTNSVGLVFVRN